MSYIKSTQQVVLNEFTKRLELIIRSSPSLESAQSGEETLDGFKQDASQRNSLSQRQDWVIQNTDPNRERTLEFAQMVAAKLTGRISTLNNLKDLGERTQRAVSHPQFNFT
jgi:hypothetical protein